MINPFKSKKRQMRKFVNLNFDEKKIIKQKPNLSGLNDIISVQPSKSLPVGQIFYLDFKYEGKYKKPGKQIFSEIDPYGEEIWEEEED